jgi:hypothetical protein
LDVPKPPPEPPGNPPKPVEKLEEDDVGVTRPPPTVELNPMSDELTTEDELCDATAALDSCANEEPLLFRFCSEPIPMGDPVFPGVPYTENGLLEEELIN